MTPLLLAALLAAPVPAGPLPAGPLPADADQSAKPAGDAAPVDDAPAAPAAVRLDVYPPAVHLSSATDRQGVIAVLTRADGSTVDVTAEAVFTPADDRFAKRTVGAGGGVTFHPAADGVTSVEVAHAGLSTKLPVTVERSAETPPVGFRNDVMPVFARAGCNMGSCHGAARGKDGFRLSLFGFDPAGDHFRLTREHSGRRLNLAVPERSLLYEKSVGTVSHSGGKRFEPGRRTGRRGAGLDQRRGDRRRRRTPGPTRTGRPRRRASPWTCIRRAWC